jgi:sulfur relay (sulfurtransferase) DsrC/TusE family protein
MRDIIIKRQQAEIERLRTDLEDFVTEYDAYKEAVDVALAEARAEAIREFAEKLKELSVYGTIREYSYANNMSYMLEDMVSEDIDILVKEMTEKEGGKG